MIQVIPVLSVVVPIVERAGAPYRATDQPSFCQGVLVIGTRGATASVTYTWEKTGWKQTVCAVSQVDLSPTGGKHRSPAFLLVLIPACDILVLLRHCSNHSSERRFQEGQNQGCPSSEAHRQPMGFTYLVRSNYFR